VEVIVAMIMLEMVETMIDDALVVAPAIDDHVLIAIAENVRRNLVDDVAAVIRARKVVANVLRNERTEAVLTIEAIRKVRVMVERRNVQVVVVVQQVVNVADRNRKRPLKNRRAAVRNVVHHDPNRKIMMLAMIMLLFIQKKVQHRQDANVTIAVAVIMTLTMTIITRVAMKVNDERIRAVNRTMMKVIRAMLKVIARKRVPTIVVVPVRVMKIWMIKVAMNRNIQIMKVAIRIKQTKHTDKDSLFFLFFAVVIWLSIRSLCLRFSDSNECINVLS